MQNSVPVEISHVARKGSSTRIRFAVLVTCISSLYAPTILSQPTISVLKSSSAGSEAPVGSHNRSQNKDGLEKLISVSFKAVPIADAIDEVARVSGIRISYVSRVFRDNAVVTLRADTMKARDVLNAVLRGTGVRIQIATDGSVKLIDGADSVRVKAPVRGGKISGVVIDSVSRLPISSATVTITPEKRSIKTNASGVYEFGDVGEGEHIVTVRIFGYQSVSRSAEVATDEVSSIKFTMSQLSTQLNSVVTTATGQQRKIEVGNSIVSLNVDSLMQVAPIFSVTDLIESRVPGMALQRTSGSPGDPSRIRLRGTSSIYQNNDPIIVVDGVRMYSQQSDDRNVNSSGDRLYATPSPLDQIDPNSVEKIEVLKGPSASALYGSDAANGVIIVTTKRGRSGPSRWNMSLQSGMSYFPGSWPELKYVFGTRIEGGVPGLCSGYCGDATIDSVVSFQALNNSRLTALGRGGNLGASATVSGGSSTVQYSFTGSTGNTRGVLKLPKIEEERYKKFQGQEAPGWMRRPDMLEERSANGRIQVQLTNNTTMAVTTMLAQVVQQRTSMSATNRSAINELQRVYVDVSQLKETPILGNPYERVAVRGLNMVNSLQMGARPLSWLPITATVGFNTLTQNTETSIARGLLIGADSGGVWRGSTKVASGATGNLLTYGVPFGKYFTMSAGLNFDRGRTNDQSGTLRGISSDVTDPALGEDSAGNQFSRASTERKSFGWFFEPKLSLGSRFFVMPGFRLDNNGLSGNNAKFNSLPKMNLSWIASDENYFPFKDVLSLFRVRTAFGVSGVQPSPGDMNRLYTKVDGTASLFYGDMLTLSYLGNTKLRPERGVEWEGGFDTELWSNRLSLNFTYANKRRNDAIISNNYGASVNGGGLVRMNVGDINNSSTEVEFNAQLLEKRLIGVNIYGSFSRARSEVVRLSDDGNDLSLPLNGETSLRYVVGYPMEGLWMVPILGFADLDGNGWLSGKEVLRGSSSIFVGSQEPNYSSTMSPSITLFAGRVNLTSMFSYTSGQIQTVIPEFISNSKDLNGYGLPPYQGNIEQGFQGFNGQAAMIGVHSNDGVFTSIGYMQNISVLRLQSLSVNVNLGSNYARLFRAKNASIALQGNNLGLWTNYIGVDPNVNGILGSHGVSDLGQLPQPRAWQLRMTLGY